MFIFQKYVRNYPKMCNNCHKFVPIFQNIERNQSKMINVGRIVVSGHKKCTNKKNDRNMSKSVPRSLFDEGPGF